MEEIDNADVKSSCDCSGDFHKTSKSLLEKVVMIIIGVVITILFRFFISA